MSERPALLVIAGPTASGKTALAIEVAQQLGAEIVSADSQQVYRGFDIGTAKPTAADRALVPHHLLDVADPTETFSAARFQALADEAIAQIAARGKRVVVAGGTGLYLRILLHGVVPAPPAAPELRRSLEAEAERIGRQALHARLAAIDPETAAKVQPTDLVRIVRALEIYELTGTTASEFRREHRFAEDRYRFDLVVLDPPREELYRRIDARTEAMFRGGLLDEVRRHLSAGLRDAAPMKSVGYLQALQHLDGTLTFEEAIARAARETRRYAKRQLTWFRREPGARFLQPPYWASELAALSGR
ncbi:MAG: tRNA (adenosine(37)-N6)-dimethylallyltransferase MiaA [Myxococcaceae bacterium]|nr:tRNA (adenosine(37)-N6)-dimethylallyltransferase MiaA [Myxococcaceae bacterium]